MTDLIWVGRTVPLTPPLAPTTASLVPVVPLSANRDQIHRWLHRRCARHWSRTTRDRLTHQPHAHPHRSANNAPAPADLTLPSSKTAHRPHAHPHRPHAVLSAHAHPHHRSANNAPAPADLTLPSSKTAHRPHAVLSAHAHPHHRSANNAPAPADLTALTK